MVEDTIEDEPCVFLKGLYLAEQAIADAPDRTCSRIAALARDRPDKAIAMGREPDGQDAFRHLSAMPCGSCSASKLAVITGGPGVGKTSTLDAILRILVAKGVRGGARCSDRASGQTHDRANRRGGQDDSPPSGGQPEAWWLHSK